MSNFSALKTAIQNAIKQNGNEEITGNLLQGILLSIVETLGDNAINTLETGLSNEATTRGNEDTTLQTNINNEANARQNIDTQLQNAINAINTYLAKGYVFAGVATPMGTPVSGRVFYVATTAGRYTYFGNLQVQNGISILLVENDSWTLHQLLVVDFSLVQNSKNPVSGGSVYQAIQNEETARRATDTWLQNNINNENSRAVSAENGLHQEIVAETDTRKQEIQGMRDDVLDLIHEYRPIEIDGNVVNAPDEEDITQQPNNLLKFKDKDYNPTIFSGLGRKYLRKNIIINENYTSFDGFEMNPEADAMLGGQPDSIFWDRLRERFIAEKDGVYYLDWQGSGDYIPVSADKIYVNENIPYFWNGEDLAVDDDVIARYGNSLTQEMMSDANTIYVIQYDFTLGEDITVPANCVLEFDGGSLRNGTIICNQTLLCGNVRLDTTLSGTILNDYFYVSWIIGNQTNVFTSILNIGACMFVDKDIALDGSIKTVESINISGNGSTISNPNKYLISGNIRIENVKFDNYTDENSIFLRIADYSERSYDVNIKNVLFDGCGLCDIFLYHMTNDGDQSTISNLVVKNSCFKNITARVINVSGLIEGGNIADNIFENIGVLETLKSMTVCISLGKDYLEGRYANNVIISHNVFNNIKVVYTTEDESKEGHAILVYGYNCVIEANRVSNIYSNREDGDPGAESEGIYVKGSYNIITNNYLYNAAGSYSDGSITLKGVTLTENPKTKDNNVISDNVIYYSYGRGIVSYGRDGIIKNNYIYGHIKAEEGIGFRSAVNNIIDGNTVEVDNSAENKTFYSGFIVLNYGCEKNRITNNTFKGGGSITKYSAGTDFVENNTFILENITFGSTSKYTSLIQTGNYNIQIYFNNNTIYLGSCRASSLFEITASTELYASNNYYKFYLIDGSEVDAIFSSLFRGGASIIIKDSTFDIDQSYRVDKVFYEESDIYKMSNCVVTNKGVRIGTSHIIGACLFKSSGEYAQKPDSLSLVKGQQYFNDDTKRPVFYDGSNWVTADGYVGYSKRFGTYNQRSSVRQNTNQGMPFFATDLNTTIYWNGSKWVEYDGASAGVLRGGQGADKAHRPTGEQIYGCNGFMYMQTDAVNGTFPIFAKSITRTGTGTEADPYVYSVTWVDATGTPV